MNALALLVRAMNWKPLVGAAVVAVAIAVVTSPGSTLDVRMYAVSMRTCALILGVGAAFALVDDAAEIAMATPMPRWRRLLVRLAACLVVVGAVSVACRFVLGQGFPVEVDLGTGGLAIESGVLALLPLSIGAFLSRWRSDHIAPVVAAGAMLLIIVGTLPARDLIWPNPGEPGWTAIHAGWLIAGALPVALLVASARRVP